MKLLACMAVVMVLGCAVPTADAHAKPRHHHHHKHVHNKHSKNYWVRPARWCGWWMRTQFGGGPEYNLARNWAKRGYAVAAQVGAVVVWRHHVGVITGRTSKGKWVVKSGNDGGRVRERARSLRGAIAFRML